MWRQAIANASDGVLYVANLETMTVCAQAQLSALLTATERNGESRPASSARVITSATPALFANVQSGKFSAALFYRVNIIHLNQIGERPVL